MAGDKVTTIDVQQVRAGSPSRPETEDRDVALGRYKSFVANNPRATRLSERTERY